MIKIKRQLSENSNVDMEDVFNIKVALKRLGHYQKPDYGLTRYPDKQLFSAIKSFQKAENLKIDGVINPEGETITALNLKLPLQNPGVKSPTLWCACGAPHGGAFGDVCWSCYLKA